MREDCKKWIKISFQYLDDRYEGSLSEDHFKRSDLKNNHFFSCYIVGEVKMI